MNRNQINDEMATAVATEVRAGKMIHQVAKSMRIDDETAALAFVKWSISEHMPVGSN